MNFFGFISPFLAGTDFYFIPALFATFAVLFGLYTLVRFIDV